MRILRNKGLRVPRASESLLVQLDKSLPKGLSDLKTKTQTKIPCPKPPVSPEVCVPVSAGKQLTVLTLS